MSMRYEIRYESAAFSRVYTAIAESDEQALAAFRGWFTRFTGQSAEQIPSHWITQRWTIDSDKERAAERIGFDVTHWRTTPAQVRAEIKRRGLTGLELVKTVGFWYVLGPATEQWFDHCLYTRAFYGRDAAYWVDQIEGMAGEKIVGID